MDKQQIISIFNEGHEDMKSVLTGYSMEEMEKTFITNTWTIRDVIIHITEWYKEFIWEIEGILLNKPIIHAPNCEDEYNKKYIERNKSKPIKQILAEWETVFAEFIMRITVITPEEWNFECKGIKKSDGSPYSIASLFAYLQSDKVCHEGMHAREISMK